MARFQMPEPRKPVSGKAKAGIGAAIVAGVALASPLAERWEGYEGKVYLDPAKIATQCFGETEDIDPTRIFTKDECAAKLRVRMARDYAPPIIACIPSMAEESNRYAFAALIDASYNAGPAAVCRSPMARAFNAGEYAKGCDAFEGWYVSARNRVTGKRVVYRGLINRRLSERELCRKGLQCRSIPLAS